MAYHYCWCFLSAKFIYEGWGRCPGTRWRRKKRVNLITERLAENGQPCPVAPWGWLWTPVARWSSPSGQSSVWRENGTRQGLCGFGGCGEQLAGAWKEENWKVQDKEYLRGDTAMNLWGLDAQCEDNSIVSERPPESVHLKKGHWPKQAPGIIRGQRRVSIPGHGHTCAVNSGMGMVLVTGTPHSLPPACTAPGWPKPMTDSHTTDRGTAPFRGVTRSAFQSFLRGPAKASLQMGPHSCLVVFSTSSCFPYLPSRENTPSIGNFNKDRGPGLFPGNLT